MIIILILTAMCNLIQFFISNYFIALIFRIIPAILYPIIVSSALTIVGEISPDDTNKVVLGLSAGSILGLSVTSYLGLSYGYQISMLWFCLVDVIALVFTFFFIPEFEGNKEPVVMQIGHAKSKIFLISILYVLCMIVGISITYNYIPTYLDQVTHLDAHMLFFTLLLMGLISMFGATLFGYFIKKDGNKTVLFYPIGFVIIMFGVGSLVQLPFYEFCILMVFAIFDGSAYTVSQYWVTSSIRGAPEFANGIFLFMCNLGIFVGTMLGGIIIDMIDILYIFYGSMIFMLMAIPFVIIRIKLYPKAH